LYEIEFDYKSNVAWQFVMTTERQGGLVNNNISCLIISQIDHQIIWIPNEQELDEWWIMMNDFILIYFFFIMDFGKIF
jgi:hypothetical protein